MMDISEGIIDIKAEKAGEVTILHIKGRLDAISSPITEKKVFDHINEGINKFLLDFAKIDYISSAGLRMLLSVSKKLKSTSGKLVLCYVTPSVMDVLRMSGFDHVLEIAKSEEDALRTF